MKGMIITTIIVIILMIIIIMVIIVMIIATKIITLSEMIESKNNILLAGKISIGVILISSESPALPHICRKLETERSLLPILGSLQQYNWNSWEQKQIIEQY